MATKLPFTGDFRITSTYGQKGNLWSSGIHQGIDLVGITNKKVYSICEGTIERAGYDKAGFGNYVRIKEKGTENRIYLAHLEKIYVKIGQQVTYTTVVGLMGKTGNATGLHTHIEIRQFQNGVAIKILNPAKYMGIPNKKGNYNSSNYQIETEQATEQNILKTLARNTNLRNAPTTQSSTATLYLANTTLYILQAGVAKSDGYIWDKVRIRVNGQEGYMINKNYK